MTYTIKKYLSLRFSPVGCFKPFKRSRYRNRLSVASFQTIENFRNTEYSNSSKCGVKAIAQIIRRWNRICKFYSDSFSDSISAAIAMEIRNGNLMHYIFAA